MEKIFKLGILILSAVFLFIFYSNSQTKRYEYQKEDETFTIFDNKTGIIHTVSFDSKKEKPPKTLLIDLVKSSVEFKEMVKK